jgi:FAD/FMN-containing dehydrogenase/Fe-S oxidoreductase
MIPRLSHEATLSRVYQTLLNRLETDGFEGEINADYANRITLSTDNSIYQVLPQAVVYPKGLNDLVRIAKCVAEPEFKEVTLTPRGGGTGTNGQSLTDGLVVDLSKHMNSILEINPDERWVRVQTGVVKDQLNAALRPYGLFFAPELSTSNRATIGGMINTDASGQGSCLYGKTRDHVLELTSVLLDGTLWTSKPITADELTKLKARDDKVGEIHRTLDRIANEKQALIEAKFPKLNRCLTGYDLAHIYDESGQFNLNSVLCGAEGSLGFIAEAKLNVLPIPTYSALINIKYDSFEASLRDAKDLMTWGPTSIETVDSKVLNLAMEDIIWDTVSDYFPNNEGEPTVQGINLVEYTSDDEADLLRKVGRLKDHLDTVAGQSGKNFGYTVALGADEINKIWAMRKKSVGLLGNAQGEKRPIPFVEDTAVPPEHLADFIMAFRAVLDKHALSYGMFGHVDAGVLHVRPAIDMKDEQQVRMIRVITDEVMALTQKYHGLLWGEHGKGVRSEYAPAFFGELYPELQRIKGVFDPCNQLNPGKIATPLLGDAELLKIDAVTTRGEMDRQILDVNRQHFSSAMYCNGNGACYNYDPNDAMCPSWKGTRERQHSPKGRSSLIREWTRLMSQQGVDLPSTRLTSIKSNKISHLFNKVKNQYRKHRGEYDYSHEVHASMMGCLACKSCVGQCPIKVNVPDFRAKFLSLYYDRYFRPAKDYMIAGLELMIPWLAKWPAPYNCLMGSQPIRAFLRQTLGMVDSPLICTHTLEKGLKARGVALATEPALCALTPDQKEKSVILVQDAFTSFFETQVVLDAIDFLTELGFKVWVAPFTPNGKPLHVHGFLGAFENTAQKSARKLSQLAEQGIPLIGIEPSMTLTYRQEYAKLSESAPKVLLMQEWLAEQAFSLDHLSGTLANNEYRLLAHCTEKTTAAASIKLWQRIFEQCGQSLKIQPVGCCGMAGTYGHETQNLETSKKLYQLSWSEVVNDPSLKGRLVATGYSCRSQVKRLDQHTLPHPAQVLLALIRSAKSTRRDSIG